MNKTFQTIVVLSLIVILGGCSKSSFDYLGKTYTPPTTNPEIFFRQQDIPEKYEVMGKVMAEVPYSKNLDYIQKKIETVAREHGADAILLSDVEIRKTGYTSGGGGVSKRGKVNVGAGGKKTSDTEMKSLEATLLKYK
jgi:hypothetical protein